MGKAMMPPPPPDPNAWTQRMHALEANTRSPSLPFDIEKNEDREWQEWEKELDEALAERRRQFSIPPPTRISTIIDTTLLVATVVVVLATLGLVFSMAYWALTYPLIPPPFTGGSF